MLPLYFSLKRYSGVSVAKSILNGILDLPRKNLKFKAKNAGIALAKLRLFNEKN